MPDRDDIFEIRRENVRALMAEWGGPTSLAAKLGHKSGSQLSQIAGPNPTRPIGENLARKIEKTLDLPTNWLDKRHARDAPAGLAPSTVDEELLSKTVALVMEKVRDLPKGRVTNERFSTLVSLVYERASGTGHIDESYLTRLLILST